MSNSLTDKSTETFWESRDEPRAKAKQITVTFDKTFPIFGVAVHIDNQKDGGVSGWVWLLSWQSDVDNGAAFWFLVRLQQSSSGLEWWEFSALLFSQLLCYSHICGPKGAQ